MLFSSMEFICLFLPVVVLVNFLLPKKVRNYWLLIASLFFYAWGEPKFVLVMMLSILFNYCLALLIDGREAPRQQNLRKIFLVIAIAGNLLLLGVFKYLNFITANLHRLFPSTPVTDIALPIGISFFTFQAMSYVIDVYRKNVPVQKNLFYLGLYIAFFPQLIAGPIVRYSTISDQIENRVVTFEGFSDGLFRFLVGFAKKILLANTMAIVADAAFESAGSGLSVGTAWLGAVCYSLQLLFDFSGYSDMAIGLGRMFGFTFLENFNYPYMAGSFTEFWRRWHISLSYWFRDYVYYPLGGSRVKTKARLIFNLAVVWLLTGIWHGANWTFILWGAVCAVLIIIEKLGGIPAKAARYRTLGIFYRIFTILFVVVTNSIFRSVDISSAFSYIGSMFGLTGNSLTDPALVRDGRNFFVMIIISVICCLPVVPFIRSLLEKKKPGMLPAAQTFGRIGLIVLFLLCISSLVMNAHNPFIYFNF